MKIKRTFTIRHLKTDSQSMWIVDLIMLAGFAESRSEARRVIRQGGVKINEVIMRNEMMQVDLSSNTTLRVGKRLYADVVKETEQ